MYGMTKKDLINAKNSSIKVSDYLNTPVTVTGCALTDKVTTNELGEVTSSKKVGYIATNVGVFGFTSSVIMDAMSDLEELLTESDEPVQIQFNERRSNSGKTFYTLSIL